MLLLFYNSPLKRFRIYMVICWSILLFVSGFNIRDHHYLYSKFNPRIYSSLRSSKSKIDDLNSDSNNILRDSKKISEVIIEAPSLNSRKITASIVIDSPIQSVWSILTDYNNLATHVPNLVESYLVPSPNPNGLRLFQEGAQKIIGFDFRASLVMDMVEEKEEESRAIKERQLSFKLVESRMFSTFDGTWSLRYHSRNKVYDPELKTFVYKYKTKLTYSVLVKPKGVVPVMALEWRIKEDVPVNLAAVKIATEKVSDTGSDDNAYIQISREEQVDWGTDETLGSYIRQPNNSKQITKYEQKNFDKKSSTYSVFSMISTTKNKK